MLGVGAAAMVALLVARAAWAAWRAGSAASAAGTARAGTSGVAAWLAGAGVPVTAATGARFALQPGRGRTAVPVRSALAGTALSVLTVVAAFTFGANLLHLVHTPRLYGQTWDVAAEFGFGGVTPQVAERVLRFHLVDNTRGEPTHWRRGDVRAQSLALTVTAATPDGVELRLDGSAVLATSADVEKADRGYEVRLAGRLR